LLPPWPLQFALFFGLSLKPALGGQLAVVCHVPGHEKGSEPDYESDRYQDERRSYV
jgi:hypothetical protein